VRHVRLPVDGSYGWFVQRLTVTFYCPHCQRALEASGLANKLMCLRCRCIFLVTVSLQEIKGPALDPNIRQLPSAVEAEGSTGEPGKESVPDGSSACGQSDVPEGHPI